MTIPPIFFTINIPSITIPPKIGLLIVLVFVNLALAWRTFISNKRHPTNIFFALTIIMVALWTFGTLLVQTFISPVFLGISARIAYVSPIFIAFFFFLFSFHLGYKIFPLKRWYVITLIIISAVMSVIILAPNVFLAWSVPLDRHFKPEISLFWHIVFAVYFSTVMLLAFFVLFLKSRKMDGIWRKRTKQSFIAVAVAFIGGSAFNLWFALIRDDSLTWIGPIFTIFMAAYIWYHIFWVPGRVPKRYRPEH